MPDPRPKISDAELDNWFSYHPPTGPAQPEIYRIIRQAGLGFAATIRNLCPASADTTAAIRKVREAVMTANASIACEQPGPLLESIGCTADDIGLPDDPLGDPAPVDERDDPGTDPADVDPSGDPPPLTDPEVP